MIKSDSQKAAETGCFRLWARVRVASENIERLFLTSAFSKGALRPPFSPPKNTPQLSLGCCVIFLCEGGSTRRGLRSAATRNNCPRETLRSRCACLLEEGRDPRLGQRDWGSCELCQPAACPAPLSSGRVLRRSNQMSCKTQARAQTWAARTLTHAQACYDRTSERRALCTWSVCPYPCVMSLQERTDGVIFLFVL